jgi:hypothetical protein
MNYSNFIDNDNGDLLEEYSEYIDRINDAAYKDVYMLSNPSLSKNPYSGSTLLSNLIQKKSIRSSKRLFIRSILAFYAKNIFYLIIWVIQFSYVKLFARDENKIENNNIVFIDTFFGKNQIDESMDFNDAYFDGLYSILDKCKINYILLPNIFGSNSNLIDKFAILRYFSKINNSTITEFDILDSSDLYRIVKFIIRYPYRVNKLSKLVKNQNKIDELFLYDLVNTIGKTSFHAYVKYLFGAKLKLKYSGSQIKLISWCENQAIDKNLYRGIRGKNTHIYGCQFFIKYPVCQSHYITDGEKKFGTTPDTILVTGSYYVPENSNHEYKIGPAFRYKSIFNSVKKESIHHNSGAILVMLSYIEKDSEKMIDLLKEGRQFKGRVIHLKIHPDHKQHKQKYEKYINMDKWKIINNIDNIQSYSIVITSGSGTAMEFAAMGLSIIILATTTIVANPMPDYGKGIIWELANNSPSLESAYRLLVNQRNINKDKIFEHSRYYRKKFFSPVDDSIVMNNFGLKNFCG